MCTGAWEQTVPSGFASIYAVQSGSWLLVLSDSVELALEAGEMAVLTDGTGHRLVTGQVADLEPKAGYASTAEASLIQGHLALSSLGSNAFRQILPRCSRLTPKASDWLQRIEPMVQLISREQVAARPGWRALVGNLLHTMFVEAIREILAQGEDLGTSDQLGWAHAALDRSLSTVLTSIHDQPEKQWTVAELARQAKMSKSSFCERFTSVVGQSPLQYLTEYRMRRACNLLESTELGVGKIATLVGYQAASSFSTCFKRWIGKSPKEFRKTQLNSLSTRNSS